MLGQPTTLEEALARGMLPTARLIPVLERLMANRRLDWDPLDEVTPWVGDADRVLYRWQNEVEYVGFDSADRVFCLLHADVIEIWTEELADLYYALEFPKPPKPTKATASRCRRRGCSNEIVKAPRAKVKYYCSKACKNKDSARRRRQRDNPVGRYGKNGYCVNGHDKSPENTNAKGKCLVCKRDQARAKYHSDAAHRHKLVQNARRRRAAKVQS